MRQTPEFWIAACDEPDAVLMNVEDVRAFNRNAYARDPNLVVLPEFPRQLTAGDVQARMSAGSRRPEGSLFHDDDRPVTETDWRRYQAGCNLAAVPEPVAVRFAMAHTRADMRRWPTADVVHANEETRHLDRFQENGLFPGDIVAVLHASADGRWWFVQSYNYAGWVRAGQLAEGALDEMLAFRDAGDALVVTGDFVDARPLGDDGRVITLDMGVRLPLARSAHTPGGCFRVRLPVRDDDGRLDFVDATIDADADVRVGHLPFTRRNLVEQAFKFLGEPYGWGHSRNARDCTGLVSEVYRSMGFVLPRNSGQQGESVIGMNTRFAPETSAEEKLQYIRRADVGDLLYSTGHVMMCLGNLDGQPWVIHDLAGAGWRDADGRYHEREFTGVSVTPLVSLHMSRDVTYLDEMYAIKSIRTTVGES